jgi:hypothetical protein
MYHSKLLPYQRTTKGRNYILRDHSQAFWFLYKAGNRRRRKLIMQIKDFVRTDRPHLFRTDKAISNKKQKSAAGSS